MIWESSTYIRTCFRPETTVFAASSRSPRSPARRARTSTWPAPSSSNTKASTAPPRRRGARRGATCGSCGRHATRAQSTPPKRWRLGGFQPTNQPTNLLAMASNPRVNDEANWENPSKTINTSYEHKSHKSANHHPGLAQQEPFISAGGQGGERSCPTMDMDHDRSGSSQDLRRSKTTDPIG